MPDLHVEIVSPEQVLYSGEAEIVVCRTSEGEVAFLPGHAPFLGMLGIAQVWVREPGGTDQYAAVHSGFVEVSNDRVSILSDVAELPAQIDAVRAETARDSAEAHLRDSPDDPEWKAALARAELRIQVAEGVTRSP